MNSETPPPEPTLDEALMRAGESLVTGAPPLTPAQVDRVVAALRTAGSREA